MKQELLTWGLGLAATVLGSLKIYDILYPKAMKTRITAEADKTRIEAQHAQLDMRQDAANGVQDQCDRLLKQMMEMQGTLQSYMMEVAELRGQLASKDVTIRRLENENAYLKQENNRLMAQLEKSK